MGGGIAGADGGGKQQQQAGDGQGEEAVHAGRDAGSART
jgi:hypothetical protein